MLDSMTKDSQRNIVTVGAKDDGGKLMESYVEPIMRTQKGRPFTLAEVTIRTGRTHQIRAQLAKSRLSADRRFKIWEQDGKCLCPQGI